MPPDLDDLAVFAEFSAQIQIEYSKDVDDPWKASPFQWILERPSRQKGAIGERLISAWAEHEGFTVDRPSDSGHDCVLDGLPVEVKFSTLWASGVFKFQQIRDQSYELAALLGIQPQKVQLWIVPKPELWTNAVGQHTGATAQDTKWLSFKAATPPSWLAPYGDSLADAKKALEEASRLRP